MDDVAYLRERIPTYAGYADEAAQRRVDQQVRAYVGEALAGLRTRLSPTGEQADLLDKLIVHCQFGDQQIIRAIDHGALAGAEIVDYVHHFDRSLVDAAGRAGSVDATGVDALLRYVATVFRQRTETIETGSPDGVAGDDVN
jgi:hypothetical protein